MRSGKILNFGALCSLLLMAVLWFSISLLQPLYAEELTVSIEQPRLDASPYHRPYMAVWLENSSRKGVVTLALWREQSDWLKDLRQWWRKLGRSGYSQGHYRIEELDSAISDGIEADGNTLNHLDGITGATRKPGVYSLSFDTKDLIANANANASAKKGEYYLNVEASREEGGRDFIRQKIQLGSGQSLTYEKSGQGELSAIKITITP